MASTVWSRAGVAHAAGAPVGAAVNAGQSTQTSTEARTAGRLFSAPPTGSAFFQPTRTIPQIVAEQNRQAALPGDKASAAFWYGLNTPTRLMGDAAEFLVRDVKERGLFGSIAHSFADRKDTSTLDAVKAAKASPGQTLDLAFNGDPDGNGDAFDLLDDPERTEERVDYFDTGIHKWATGAFDFAFNIFADPTIVVGKTTAPLRAARGVTGAADVERAADAAKASDLTGKSKDLRDIWDNAIAVTEPGALTDGTIAALSRSKYFAQSQDAGAIPYMMGRANELFTDAAGRQNFKRDILAAGAGDLRALDRVHSQSQILASELENLNSSIDSARFARAMSSPTADMASLFEGYNTSQKWIRELEAHRPILQKEFEALERVKQVGYASGEKIEGVAAQKGELANIPVDGLGGRKAAVREVASVAKTVQAGRFTTPFHLVTGRHIPTMFRLSAPDAPTVFREALNRASKSGLLDRNDPILRQLDDDFMAAASRDAVMTKSQRGAVVTRFESLIDERLAAKHGMDLGQVQTLMRAARSRRASMVHAVQSRAYKADPGDGYAVLREDDDAFALHPDIVRELTRDDAPVMGSQIADHVSILDAKMIDDFMKRHGKAGVQGFLERGLGGVWNVTEEFLTAGNRLWKFGALFRLAYPMRVQIDTQARLLAKLGALHYFDQAVSGTFNTAYNNLRRVDTATLDQMTRKFHAHREFDDLIYQEKLSGTTPEINARKAALKDVMKEEPVANSGKSQRVRGTEMARLLGKDQYINKKGEVVGKRDRLRAAYGSTEEQQRVLSFMDGRESWLGLLTDGEQALSHRYRSTGSWGKIAGDNPQWQGAYSRAVNQQIRNDPLAMQIVRGASNDQLYKWLDGTAEGKAYWSALGEHYLQGGKDALLVNLRQQVDTLLPSDSVRAIVSERAIKPKEAEELWVTNSERPQVPSEILEEASAKSAIADAYKTVEGAFFKTAAELPENMLGRHPYYQAQFRSRMQTLIEDSGAQSDTLTLDQVRQLRARASTQAREDVGKVMFDTSAQTNLGYHLRFLSPFYSAWWDMMTKWGRIMGDDWAVAPLIYKGFTAPNRAGLVVDDDGNEITAEGKVIGPDGTEIGTANPLTDGNLVIPAPEFVKNWSGSGDLVISKRALNVIFQGDPFFLPGPGPMVNITANQILNKVAKGDGPTWADSPFWNYLLSGFGVTGDTPAEQLAPAWMKNAWTAYRQDRGEPRFADSYAQEYQSLVAEVKNGDRSPMSEDELEDVAAQRTRNKFLIQFLGSYVSPVSTRPQGRFQFYIQQWRNYQRDYGLDAYDQFISDYPEYSDLAISLSVNETGIDASEEAWQSVQPYRREIARDPEYGWMFAGANNLLGEFSPDVYTAEKSQDTYPGSGEQFRRSKTATEVITDAAVRSGWADYSKVNSQLTDKLHERGLSSFQQKGAEDLRQIRDQFVDDLKHENRDWAEAFATRDTGEAAAKFLSYAVQQVSDHPELGDRTDFQTLSQYLQVRQALQQRLAAMGRRSLPLTEAGMIEDPEVRQLRVIWDTFTAETYDQDLGFGQMWDRALEGDDLAFKLGADGQILSGIW